MTTKPCFEVELPRGNLKRIKVKSLRSWPATPFGELKSATGKTCPFVCGEPWKQFRSSSEGLQSAIFAEKALHAHPQKHLMVKTTNQGPSCECVSIICMSRVISSARWNRKIP